MLGDDVTRLSLSNVLCGVTLVALGATCGPGRDRVVVHTEPKIIRLPARQFTDSLTALSLEVDGLRARLAGREKRVPVVIVRTDTLVSASDTVVQILRVNPAGNLTIATLVVRDSLWAPEIHKDIPVSDCDDGWSWNAGQVVCDRARLGHIYLGVGLGIESEVQGFAVAPSVRFASEAVGYWQPSYRSSWRVALSLDSRGRAALGVTRGFRIF